jgi:hypothetical protein
MKKKTADGQSVTEHTQLFVGFCDVCGHSITSSNDHTRDGISDIYITKEGKAYALTRHYATAPEYANPDCAVYSSPVFEIAIPDELLNHVPKNPYWKEWPYLDSKDKE